MRTAVYIGWAVFWAYWLIASRGAKPGSHRRALPPGVRVVFIAFIAIRVFGTGSSDIHDTALQVGGLALFVAGLGFAVWARVHLGHNWGMPMTEKNDPELVTSGPYRLVRHPIYTGILLAMAGTTMAASLYWLFPLAISAAYFLYSARVEERLMAGSFPADYSAYRARTKMLIPFVL